jgi:hypothetical protein
VLTYARAVPFYRDQHKSELVLESLHGERAIADAPASTSQCAPAGVNSEVLIAWVLPHDKMAHEVLGVV